METEPAKLAVGSSDSLHGERHRTKETLGLRHGSKNVRQQLVRSPKGFRAEDPAPGTARKSALPYSNLFKFRFN